MANTVAPGNPVTPPEEFPVMWENPEDAQFPWHLDNHSPKPLAPLSYAVAAAVLGGFNDAFPQIGLPIQFRLAQINGYVYAAILPLAAPPYPTAQATGAAEGVASSPPEMAAQMTAKQLEKLRPLLKRFDAYWQDDLLPEINQHFAYFESADLRGMSQRQLNAHFRAGLERAREVGELHARAAMPAMAAMSMFEELYRDLFPGAGALDALRLLQGFDNQTLAADRALWRLGRVALTMPPVVETLAAYQPGDVISALKGTAEGREFLAELRAYLGAYGQRLEDFGQLTESAWIEEPVTAIACLQAYVDQPERDLEAEQARLAAERGAAVSAARAELARYPQPVRDEFETLLRAAQAAVGVKEDNHWVVERLFYQMRRLALVFGRRLADGGALATADDVFYLTPAEMLAAGAGDAPAPSAAELQARKDSREHFMHVAPPPMLGTMPALAPEDNSPFGRALTKADGAMPVSAKGDAQSLTGEPGSAGVARGPARIIHSLAEAGKLQPGDVLVATSTMPPWTSLFSIVAAVVTDSGGVLSHCAVVAREYGIPAVVGTSRATQLFQDGQLLEVDGGAGVVRVLGAPQA